LIFSSWTGLRSEVVEVSAGEPDVELGRQLHLGYSSRHLDRDLEVAAPQPECHGGGGAAAARRRT